LYQALGEAGSRKLFVGVRLDIARAFCKIQLVDAANGSHLSFLGAPLGFSSRPSESV
jgi:hypothetical protein